MFLTRPYHMRSSSSNLSSSCNCFYESLAFTLSKSSLKLNFLAFWNYWSNSLLISSSMTYIFVQNTRKEWVNWLELEQESFTIMHSILLISSFFSSLKLTSLNSIHSFLLFDNSLFSFIIFSRFSSLELSSCSPLLLSFFCLSSLLLFGVEKFSSAILFLFILG